MLDLHTFSIVARDAGAGAFGIAVATARPAVGTLVPWVSLRGAIATQARVNTDLGRRGLALLDTGVPVADALRSLLADDADADIRQVHALDLTGEFRHTGARCVPWCGDLGGDGYSVAGNMLAGPAVLDAMAGAYERARATGRYGSVRTPSRRPMAGAGASPTAAQARIAAARATVRERIPFSEGNETCARSSTGPSTDSLAPFMSVSAARGVLL